jgi:serine/threonine protein kinase
MSNLIGQSLGRYHILEQLGEGGMATVYKAYDTRLERDVAVKVIRVDQFAPAGLEHILKRFEREAKALAKLTHPNIVHINDYGEHNSIPYLVMDYLPGGTLKQRLGKPIPWQEAARLLTPVAEALGYAHENGVIHRDVKPSNILLTAKGQPMLTDFGIAKMLESEETQALTVTGVGMGTPEYMAPEQANARLADQRADIYSLGVVFYELVTGRKPFIADTPLAVLIKQTSEPLPRPKQFVPELPEMVEKVLFKALAKKPEDRYQSMGEFETALAQLVSWQGIRAEVQQDEQIRMGEEKTSIVPPSPLNGQNSGKWRRWVVIGGILALACIVLATLGISFLFFRQKVPSAPAVSPTIEPTFTNALPYTSLPTYTSFPTYTKILTQPPTNFPEPRMFNFQACLDTCNGNNSLTSFPEKTKRINLQWQYENIPANSHYIRISSYEGLVWAKYDCTWPYSLSGTESVNFTEPGGIRSGDWTLTVYINGEKLLNENIHVEGNWNYWSTAGDFTTCYGTH